MEKVKIVDIGRRVFFFDYWAVVFASPTSRKLLKPKRKPIDTEKPKNKNKQFFFSQSCTFPCRLLMAANGFGRPSTVLTKIRVARSTSWRWWKCLMDENENKPGLSNRWSLVTITYRKTTRKHLRVQEPFRSCELADFRVTGGATFGTKRFCRC